MNNKRYHRNEIIDLYFRRWEIENYYRDEKVTFEIERFHSKSVNGILQELYSAMIMSVIARTMMAMSSQFFLTAKQEVQFKNSVLTLASDAALLVSDNHESAIKIFDEVLADISRVKYYRPQKRRPSQLRVNKSPVNKWNANKIKKLAATA